MKRKIILLGVLMLGLQTVGFSVDREKREPCAPYNNERTLSQLEEILTKDGVYYDNYRYEVVKVYNSIADYRVSATKDGVREMLQHSVFVDASFFNPEDYENGVKVGDHIMFTDLLGRESKYWLAAVDENGKIIDGYMKVNCVNIQKRKHLFSFEKEKLREAVVIDTIRKTTYIYDTICHIEYLPYQAQQEPMFAVMLNMEMGYQQQQYYPQYIPMQPIFYGESGGDYTNIVNNYTYNNTTNNYCKPPKPDPDPVDPGGPIDPPGHTDGPAPAPGHDDKSTSSSNGGSPRNVPSNNYEETFTDKARSIERATASTSRNRTSSENKNTNSNARSTSPQSNNYGKEWERINQERVKTPTSNTRSSSPTPVKQRESVTDFSQGANMRSTLSDKSVPTNPRTVNDQGMTKSASVGNGRTQGVPHTRPTPTTQDGKIGNTRTMNVQNSRTPETKSRPVDYNRNQPQRVTQAKRPVDYNRNQPQRVTPSYLPQRGSGFGSPGGGQPSRGSGFSGSSGPSHNSGRMGGGGRRR